MHNRYHIENTSEIITPALVVFRELVEDNLDKMLEIAGSASRMRPHCKTQHLVEVVFDMHAMWTTAAKENLNMCCLINPIDLPALDRMCRDFPDTPVVIDHICRIGVTGKVEEKEVKALCDMARHKNVTVKISAFYALGKKKPPYHDLAPLIKRVYDAFGPKRLMWATDCPFQTVDGHTYKQSIDLIKHGLDFLSETDKAWLLRETAEKVFFH